MQTLKKPIKIALTLLALILLTYPWWSLALFKYQFLNAGHSEHLSHKSEIEILRVPEIMIPQKEQKIGKFRFSVPSQFELKDNKDEGLTLIFKGKDEEMIYAYKGIRKTEGWIDSCPQLRDIHTNSIEDLNVLSLNVIRSFQIARALMIKKVSDIATRGFRIYKKEDEVLTIHHPNEKMSIIETQRGCELLTINLIGIPAEMREKVLAPIIADSIQF
ncbi:MAG: hypothetical protein NXH75_17065 [Halobacteriovoraceae bacterium]|nr:hypothetical protein [Halobacteriovoraceae bacterium]